MSHLRGESSAWPRIHRLVLAAALALVIAGLATLTAAAVVHHRHSAALAAQRARQEELRRAAAADASKQPDDRGRQLGKPPRAGASHGPFSAIDRTGARLVIPALHVNARVVPTGAIDGSMLIPANVHKVGWYNGTDAGTGRTGKRAVAAAPGQSGVAVLAGHVNWSGQGPGVLRDIKDLQPGNKVKVVGSNGRVTTWRVSRKPVTTPKSELPRRLFTNTGPARLALVTCGGAYNPVTRHYADNIIVWADLVAVGGM